MNLRISHKLRRYNHDEDILSIFRGGWVRKTRGIFPRFDIFIINHMKISVYSFLRDFLMMGKLGREISMERGNVHHGNVLVH